MRSLAALLSLATAASATVAPRATPVPAVEAIDLGSCADALDDVRLPADSSADSARDAEAAQED
jgi:hypothetical protein